MRKRLRKKKAFKNMLATVDWWNYNIDMICKEYKDKYKKYKLRFTKEVFHDQNTHREKG